MSRSILQFLPNYEIENHKVSGLVGTSLYQRVNRIRVSRRLTWSELIVGLFEKLVEDVPPQSQHHAVDSGQVDFLTG